MTTVLIKRDVLEDNYTLGKCSIIYSDGSVAYIGYSLERGWQDNQNNISCVPEGDYKLVYEYSARFGRKLWELKGVPNRAECKFHAANYWKELNGCIALGEQRIDINADGDPDVTNSRTTMNFFHSMLENEDDVQVRIINV